jgi:anti-sigma factor RsiW
MAIRPASSPKFCDSQVECINDYLDGKLEAERCRELTAHLECCAGCRLLLESSRRMLQLVRAVAPAPLSDSLRNRLSVALNQRMAEKRQRAGEAPAP